MKYEDIYLKGYQTMTEAQEGFKRYFQFYNNERFHQSLGYRTPREVYVEKIRMERGIHLSTLTHKKERGKEPEKQVITTKKDAQTMGSTIGFLINVSQ